MYSRAEAPNGTAQGGAPPQQPVRKEDLIAPEIVWHLNIVLLCLLGLLALTRVSRAAARLTSTGEWLAGHVFGSKISVVREQPRPRLDREDTLGKPHFAEKGSGVTLIQSATLTPTLQGEGGARAPPHVAACPRILRPIFEPLHWRWTKGHSLNQLVLYVGWFVGMAYAGLYKSNPFTNPVRGGAVAVSQIPWVFALGTKVNPVGYVLGVGYEKLNFLHRHVGRLIILAVNVHVIGYLYKFFWEDAFFEAIVKPDYIWGLVATVCMDMLFIFSTSWVRNNFYNLFFWSHCAAFLILIPAIYMHKRPLLNYVIAFASVYAFDRVFRLVKTRVQRAHLRAMPELGMVRMEMRSLTSGWRAGQHVRIRVLSSAMGLVGWSEVHPFTIANAPGTSSGMVLMVKKTGRWTHHLFELAKSRSAEGDEDPQVQVIVEGPYGGPGDSIFSSYSAALFVCGGSGITFGLSAMDDLLQKDAAGESRLKIIDLIWIVQDIGAIAPLLPELTALLHSARHATVNISIHYTRVSAAGAAAIHEATIPRGMHIHVGRPHTKHALDNIITNTVYGAGERNTEPHCGVLVGVCGPVALADDVRKTVSWIDPKKRDLVGGVEVHEEVFGW
ncbi:ferric reductase like transmembrane component-domain-containing protein [Schizophyllum commune]